ncbi:Apoptotic ATPase [Handroanthus impetiginosus]|uniref:Apoptotic ATPase n=1 Tax=Handroanthus impetiginosus TaxID=429701 RepID=A0A2G9G7H1_9LAMI|nr:Apoptotic ATPase [Handroanthus impetiginosus]
MVGFEKDIKELKSKLEKHPFVSVVGMPGLGKTTLAKKVFKDIKDGFDCRASVSVSQNPNIKGFARNIANQVGLEKEEQEENLKVNLYSFLRGKRYVVFLDDIWHTTAWDSLRAYIPIPPESDGRIIITSRDSCVGRYIGGENSLHQLDPFDYPTSWKLFSKSIDIPSPGLVMIDEQIVKKCRGVPLAIALVVGMLRRRERSEFAWKDVLRKIHQDVDDKCLAILGLSYRDLPTSLRPCFLYFGNFPEDYEFFASEVIRLWMAEKFIPRDIGDCEPEDVGANYISELEARNLIQVVRRRYDGRVEKFHIHDLFHSLCVNMGREITFLNTIDDHLESSSAKRVRRLSIHYCSSVAENDKLIFQMTRLRTLLIFKFDKEIETKQLNNMLGRFKLLHVLKMSVYSEVAFFPFQIGSLSCLNYLKIDSNSQVKIPSSIRNLKNLHTLDLQGCSNRVKLPIGIWKMEQLRHLLLRCRYEIGSYIMRLLCKYQEVQVLLPNLQKLVGINCFDLKPTWLLKFTNLRTLTLYYVTPEIMEVLCGPEPISKKLEVLSLESMQSDCSMNRRVSLAKYKRLMELELNGVMMKQLPELPPSLIKLTLERIQLIEDPMKILKNLPKLKILHLDAQSYHGSKMDCSGADSFPQLEILQLRFLVELEELTEGEEIGMPKLKQLVIWGCPKLMQIPERLQECLRMKN